MSFPVSGNDRFAFGAHGRQQVEHFVVVTDDRRGAVGIFVIKTAAGDQAAFEILELPVLLVFDLEEARGIKDAGDVDVAVDVKDPDVVHHGRQIVVFGKIRESLGGNIDVGRVLGRINVDGRIAGLVGGRIVRGQAAEVRGVDVHGGRVDDLVG